MSDKDRRGITGMTPERKTIIEALDRFVSVLLDGAFGIEGEHAHLDVIACAWLIQPDGDGPWLGRVKAMRECWIGDGRAPDSWTLHGLLNDDGKAANWVGKAILDGLVDGLLVPVWHWTSAVRDPDEELRDLDGLDILTRLAALCEQDLRGRLLARVELALDEMDLVDRLVELRDCGRWPILRVRRSKTIAAQRLIDDGTMRDVGDGMVKLASWSGPS